MQREPRYGDAAREVAAFLEARCGHAVREGIARECLAVDPGIGFGKTVRHNLELIARLPEVAALERPVLVGVSRKSFLGQLLDLPVERRLEGALAAQAVAVFLGASILRTHDVAATVRAAKVARAIADARRA